MAPRWRGDRGTETPATPGHWDGDEGAQGRRHREGAGTPGTGAQAGPGGMMEPSSCDLGGALWTALGRCQGQQPRGGAALRQGALLALPAGRRGRGIAPHGQPAAPAAGLRFRERQHRGTAVWLPWQCGSVPGPAAGSVTAPNAVHRSTETTANALERAAGGLRPQPASPPHPSALQDWGRRSWRRPPQPQARGSHSTCPPPTPSNSPGETVPWVQGDARGDPRLRC